MEIFDSRVSMVLHGPCDKESTKFHSYSPAQTSHRGKADPSVPCTALRVLLPLTLGHCCFVFSVQRFSFGFFSLLVTSCLVDGTIGLSVLVLEMFLLC